MHSASRGSYFLTGVLFFGSFYSIWLIDYPPFAWWDGLLMWFYEWVLDWRQSSDSTLFYLFFIVPLEWVFFGLKYLFLPGILAALLTPTTDQ